MSINRIIYGDEGQGEFYGFDDMVGALQPKREELQVLTRIGQDGERLRKTGVRARPTRLQTVLFVDDLNDANLLLGTDYISLIDGSSVEIVQYGQSFGNFRVIDVAQDELQAVSNVIGNIGGGTPTYEQRLTWIVLGTT